VVQVDAPRGTHAISPRVSEASHSPRPEPSTLGQSGSENIVNEVAAIRSSAPTRGTADSKICVEVKGKLWRSRLRRGLP